MPISGEMIWVNEFTRTYPRGVECVTCFGSEEYRKNGLCFGTDEQVCKSRIFLSFRFTGEDPEELDLFLSSICDSLQIGDHAIFCSLFLEEIFSKKDWLAEKIYKYCLIKMSETDIFVAVIRKEEESTGMLMELEQALRLKMKIVLFIKKDLKHNTFRRNADEVFEFSDESELLNQLVEF